MKTITTLFFAVGLMLAAGPKQIYTGLVTDTMCGKDHAAMKVSPDADCVRECVKHGSKYALLVGDKIYTLSDQQTPGKFAGRKVKVTGTLYPKTNILAVENIEAAK